MKNKRALKQYVRSRSFPGEKFILLGALAMLLWAFWECAIRFDLAVDYVKSHYRYVEKGVLTLRQVLEINLYTAETYSTVIVPLILACIALFAVIVILLHDHWVPSFFIIPVAVLIMFFHTSDSVFVRILNMFEGIKFASCGVVIGGQVLNTASAIYRIRGYRKRLREKERKRLAAGKHTRPAPQKADIMLPPPAPKHGTTGTLIPERKRSARSVGL